MLVAFDEWVVSGSYHIVTCCVHELDANHCCGLTGTAGGEETEVVDDREVLEGIMVCL